MSLRFKTLRTLGLIAFATIALSSQGAFAQKSDDGKEPAAAEADDGFRPVWQQQQQAKAKAAAAAAAQKALEAKRQQVAENQATDTTPQRVETTILGRWVVTCQDNAKASTKHNCGASLRIVDNNQQVVILWEIGRSADGALRASMQTPTGVLVQKGVDLKIGDTQVGKFNYAACVPQNCEANGALDEALVKKMAAASEMMVTIHARDGRDVHFKFPVNGIDKAIAAIRS